MDREKLIAKVMEDNKCNNGFKGSLAYAEAYVDGIESNIDMNKMTREQAKAKCHGIAYPEAFVQALEALGLIKFEEEKIVSPAYVIANMYIDHKGQIGYITADGIIENLKSYGYIIVKENSPK